MAEKNALRKEAQKAPRRYFPNRDVDPKTRISMTKGPKGPIGWSSRR